VKIAAGMPKVRVTITGPNEFGSRCLRMILERARACRMGGLDIFLLFDREHLAAHETR